MDDGDDGRSGWLLAAPPTLHAGLKLTRAACPCLHHTGLSLYEHQQSTIGLASYLHSTMAG